MGCLLRDDAHMTTPRWRLRIDTEAFVALGEALVVDIEGKNVVAVCDTIEEAEAMVAEANGTDVATVRRESERQAQARHEYRLNLINASKKR